MAVDLNKSLVTLEVLKMPDELDTIEEIEEYYNKHVTTKTFLIEDTPEPYVIRISTAHKKHVKSLDPEFLPEMDAYEISESIQEILREEGFPIFKHKFPEKPVEPTAEGLEVVIPEKTEIAYEVRPKKPKQVKNLSDIFDPTGGE